MSREVLAHGGEAREPDARGREWVAAAAGAPAPGRPWRGWVRGRWRRGRCGDGTGKLIREQWRGRGGVLGKAVRSVQGPAAIRGASRHQRPLATATLLGIDGRRRRWRGGREGMEGVGSMEERRGRRTGGRGRQEGRERGGGGRGPEGRGGRVWSARVDDCMVFIWSPNHLNRHY
jgi:hypothetical protein